MGTPEFNSPRTVQEWELKRAKIRDELWQLLGDLPGRPKVPSVRMIKREDRGDYILEKFEFDNAANAIVPGYLLLPKNAPGKVPAILYCHWHGGDYDIGKEELFRDDKNFRKTGPTLVKRGFAVIAIDAYCFGERNGKGPQGADDKGSAGEMTASKYNLWLGRCLWGMILRDDLMALDYLASRSEIDANRIGVTGISMGATRSWWLMALDERIKAGVAVACLTRYQNLVAHQGLKYHGIYYFVPGLLKHFDTEAIVALAAPRPLLCMNGELDGGSPTDGIHMIEQKVSPVYALYDKSGAFESTVYPRVGHEYLPEMWERTLRWFDEKLRL